MKLTSTIICGLAMLLLVGCNLKTTAKIPSFKNQETKQGAATATPQADDKGATKAPTYDNPAMLDPSKAVEKAPDTFKARFETTKGTFDIQVNRAWSPNGADRFYNLVKIGYFQDIVIFRAINGFMFQFGIHGDPAVSAKWSDANINDDPRADGISNAKGFVTFAKTGRPNSRSTQMFVNLGDNRGLDSQGFTPFGQIVDGMDVVEKINTEYGENRGSDQPSFQSQGNDYILKRYPNLDSILSVKILN